MCLDFVTIAPAAVALTLLYFQKRVNAVCLMLDGAAMGLAAKAI
jgi:hypothetical protein